MGEKNPSTENVFLALEERGRGVKNTAPAEMSNRMSFEIFGGWLPGERERVSVEMCCVSQRDWV